MKVSIVVFTLNEIEGMRAIMPQISKDWYDELLVVDGGSTDGTLEYAREQGYRVHVQRTKGINAAFVEAMEEVRGDVAIMFSPDGNSVAEKIPPLVEKMKEGYDIVICSRYCEGAKSEDDYLVTAFGNWFFTWLINVLFRSRITDSLVIYRAFRTALVKELGVGRERHSWATQFLLRAIRARKRICEIGGDEPKRIGGKRKMVPLRDGALALIMIGKEFFRRRQTYVTS
jgi:glycosyltransferase involved in cell wall biosynthesis